MESLTVKRQVTVKAKVTDTFKKAAAAKIQETIKKLDLELANIEFQLKRTVAELEKLNPQGISAAKQHYEKEHDKRLRAKEQLTQEIKQLGKIPIGSEVVQGTLDNFTEIKVGDRWTDLFNVEIVVCDDQVTEIRRRPQLDGENRQ